MRFQAVGKRLDPAHCQPAFQWRLDASQSLTYEAQFLQKGGVSGRDGASNGRVVPLYVFSSGKYGDVCALVKYRLQQRSEKGIVHGKQRSGGMRYVRGCSHIRKLQGRVRWGLDEDQPCLSPQRGLDR